MLVDVPKSRETAVSSAEGVGAARTERQLVPPDHVQQLGSWHSAISQVSGQQQVAELPVDDAEELPLQRAADGNVDGRGREAGAPAERQPDGGVLPVEGRHAQVQRDVGQTRAARGQVAPRRQVPGQGHPQTRSVVLDGAHQIDLPGLAGEDGLPPVGPLNQEGISDVVRRESNVELGIVADAARVVGPQGQLGVDAVPVQLAVHRRRFVDGKVLRVGGSVHPGSSPDSPQGQQELWPSQEGSRLLCGTPSR